MTTRFGVFGETQALGIGDPYVGTVKPDPRDHGLNMKVATCKRGQVRRPALGFALQRVPARGRSAVSERHQRLTHLQHAPAPAEQRRVL
jgi:hypothetical protein